MGAWIATSRGAGRPNTIAAKIRVAGDAAIESSTVKARPLSAELPAAWGACLLGALAVGTGILAALAPPPFVFVLLAALVLMIGAAAALRTRVASRFQPRTTTLGQTMFALVAVGVLLVTFNGVRPIPGATASDLTLVLAVLAIGLAFLDSDWKLGSIAPTWLLVAGGLLFAAAVLVGIFPARPSQVPLLDPFAMIAGGAPPQPNLPNMGAAVRFVAALVFIPIVIAAAANSPRRIKVVAEMWIAGAALGALIGCLQYAGVISLDDQYRVYAQNRVIGLTDHPNTLGLVSAMALPVAASRLGASHGRARVYYAIAVASMISAIAVSGSRAAIVGGMLGLVLVGVLHREGRRGIRDHRRGRGSARCGSCDCGLAPAGV